MNKNNFASLSIALLFILCLTPVFFGLINSWGYFTCLGLIFVLLVFAPHSLGAHKKIPYFLKRVLLGVVLFSIFRASNPFVNQYDTTLELVKWMGYACAVCIVFQSSYRDVFKAYAVLSLCALFICLYGWWQIYSQNEMVLWHEKFRHEGFLTGTYLNRNHLAGFLELCLGMTIGVIFIFKKREKPLGVFFFFAVLLLLFISFFKTGSRAGFLCLGISFLGVGWFCFRSRLKEYWIEILGVLSGGVILFLIFGKSMWFRLISFSQTIGQWDWGGRLLVWENTLQLVKDHWALGIGLGNFRRVFPQYQASELIWGWEHAHNDYLELTAELGIPVAMIFFLSFFLLWLKHLRLLTKIPMDYRMAYAAPFAGVTAFLLHGWVDFNFAVPANMLLALLLWTSVAVCIDRHRRSGEVREST